MKNLEYLTERDLEYFYRKAERGETVIIYIDPEEFLSLNISDLEEGDMTMIDKEEIQKVFEKESAILERVEERETNNSFEILVEMINDKALSEMAKRARQAGVSTLQIAYILKGDFTDTQKRLAIEAFINQKEG